MKFWLVSELFYPIETSTGFVMTKIAEKIGDKTVVNVITGPDKYHSDTLSSKNKLSNNIILNRVNIPNLNKDRKIQRILRMIILSVKMAYKLFAKVSAHDTVMVVTNPAPLLLLIAFVKKIKKFELVIIVHDVFPENILTTGLLTKKSLLFRFLLWLFNKSYQQADQIVVVGDDMKKLLQKKTKNRIKCTVITNWADAEEVYPLKNESADICNFYENHNLENKVVFQFAGNLGRVQGLKQFIDVFKQANNNNIALVLIGDGASKNELMQMVEKENIKNIFFYPTKPRIEQNRFLNACDIGLVTLNKGMFGLGVPSKTYNIWAAGKPVLFVGDEGSEIADNIKDYDIGWTFNWELEMELLTWLAALKLTDKPAIALKGTVARDIAKNVFDKTIILEKYDAVLQHNL